MTPTAERRGPVKERDTEHNRKTPTVPTTLPKQHTVYLEILAVIKFGDLPEIWPKCIIGGI